MLKMSVATPSRRGFCAALAAGALVAGCAPPPVTEIAAPRARRPIDPRYAEIYGEILGEPYPVPEVDLSEVDPRFWRRVVPYRTTDPVGSIIVDTAERHLFLVMENAVAMRYGVGVGKDEAFNFQGSAIIQRKAPWPSWTPTPDMIRRDPERYAPYRGGMPGGPDNPLGARALYLYRDGKDTYFRLHGTNEPWSIGTMVSSGCVRLLNQDVIDLYARAPIGAKVTVRNGPAAVRGPRPSTEPFDEDVAPVSFGEPETF
jgi:lipoprotein-anchoring transpeptidase ErfK/SrfK